MPPKIDAIPLSEFAKDHRVSLRTIQNWIAQGMPHRTDRGERRVVRAEANQWILERERERVKGETAPDEATERARKIRAEADLKELELHERRLELVPSTVHRERIEAIAAGLAAVAAGQLHRFERDIVQVKDAAGARQVTEAIHRALMEGARTYAEELQEQAAAAEAAEAA